jgi:hypothetical protein
LRPLLPLSEASSAAAAAATAAATLREADDAEEMDEVEATAENQRPDLKFRTCNLKNCKFRTCKVMSQTLLVFTQGLALWNDTNCFVHEGFRKFITMDNVLTRLYLYNFEDQRSLLLI